MNFVQYEDGGFFLPHRDGHYAQIDHNETSLPCGYSEITLLTIQEYLSDLQKGNRGCTRFMNPASENTYIDFPPRLGYVVVFDQSILHEGGLFHSTETCMDKKTFRLEYIYSPNADGDPDELPRVIISGVLETPSR